MTSLFLVPEGVWCTSHPLTNAPPHPHPPLSHYQSAVIPSIQTQSRRDAIIPKPAFHTNLERPANFIVSFLDYS